MSQSATGRPLRADARANREALITAAVQLFGRVGPAAPYEDVAEAAGVGRATLYRHFPTREDLLVAIFDSSLDRLQEVADGLSPGPERFERLLEACVRQQREQLPLLEMATRDTPQEQLARIRRRFEGLFEDPLREAQAAGVAWPQTSAADVRLVLLMLSGLLRPTVTDADRRRATALARSLLIRA
jgi:AcrR family transcriptional regulator